MRILEFVAQARIVTAPQIAQAFFNRANDPEQLARRRLRTLYDLHCIDRFFPPTEEGSAPQHIVLGQAGAKVLRLDKFRRIRRLPQNYRHTVAVTDVQLAGLDVGWEKGRIEVKLGAVTADLLFPGPGVAIEVDTGTETRKTLQTKCLGYKRVQSLRWLIFLTQGPQERVDFFIQHLKGQVRYRLIGARWVDLKQALDYVTQSLVTCA